MSLRRILVVVLVLSWTFSCNPDTVKKPEGSLLLSEEKLTAILTDTYLAGGLLSVPSVRDSWGLRDSLVNYSEILDSQGCTKEQLDATLYYYFASRPKKMARIYDRVIANLIELEASLKNETAPEKKTGPVNLWTGKLSYSLPDDFVKDPIWFEIPVDSLGPYVFKADYQLFQDDKSLDPRVTIYFSIKLDNGKEVTEYWDEVKLEKSGKMVKIEMRDTLRTPGKAQIKGWLLNHTSQQGIWEKHARIRNIVLRREKNNVRYE